MLDRVARQVPPTLQQYVRRVRVQLARLERDIERLSAPYRRGAARLLREASYQLGRLEARGEVGWRRLAAPVQRNAQRLLRRLERSVSPRGARPKKRKAATRTRRRAATGRARTVRASAGHDVSLSS
jgi:hypothetical protein